MGDEPANALPQFLKSLLTPWKITAILIGAFLLGQVYLALRDRPIEAVLEGDPLFATPALELSFSRTTRYDPLSFVGRGARADLWEWSSDGLHLTEGGKIFFEESGGNFVSRAPAGTRRIIRIRTNQGTDRERRVEFLYEWAEVSPPAAALLSPPPRTGEDYPGRAVLVRENGSWKVQSVVTRDYDEPLAHLQEVASGVLR